jgi:hypothetical protein
LPDILEPIFSDFSGTSKEKSAASQPRPVQKETLVKKPVRRISSQIKGPSIKDALAGKLDEEKLTAKEQHEIYTRAGEINTFTPETLKLKWEEFIGRLNDRPNLQSTLSRVPRLEEDFRLFLEIDNSVQDDLINTIKPELVSWLRKELKNSKIQLNIKISENEKEKIIYSDSEKYMEMLKKNPQLESLKKKFKLDFE